MDKNQRRELFAELPKPEYWVIQAEMMRHAAQILNDLCNQGADAPGDKRRLESLWALPEFCMAISLENLLKGILILQSPLYVSGGELDRKIKTHSLNHLLDLVLKSGAFNRRGEIDRDLLKELTSFSMWKAKYLVEMRAEKTERREMTDETFGKFLAHYNILVDHFNAIRTSKGNRPT